MMLISLVLVSVTKSGYNSKIHGYFWSELVCQKLTLIWQGASQYRLEVHNGIDFIIQNQLKLLEIVLAQIKINGFFILLLCM